MDEYFFQQLFLKFADFCYYNLYLLGILLIIFDEMIYFLIINSCGLFKNRIFSNIKIYVIISKEGLLIQNIIYLSRKLTGCEMLPFPSLTERRPFLMTTYEELTLIVNVALLIVAILTYTHKK